MPNENLTAKQRRFAEEYAVDLNGTQAAIRAGYSNKGAEVQASELLRIGKVRLHVDKLLRERSKRTEITADRVLQELARIAFFDMRKLYREDGSLKPVTELDDDAAAVLAGVDVVEMAGGAKMGGSDGLAHIPMFTKKAKIPDKVAALGLAMRHLGMLKDKVEHTGKDGKDLPIASPVLISPGMIADPEAWSKAAGGQ